MKPIEPFPIVDSGIGVYTPFYKGYRYMKIEIYYFKSNPLFSWATCESDTNKLWEQMVVQEESEYTEGNEKGTLFIYYSNGNLKQGFYKIKLAAFKGTGESIEGSLTVGVLKEKKRLIIGMPYSVYSSILLN